MELEELKSTINKAIRRPKGQSGLTVECSKSSYEQFKHYLVNEFKPTAMTRGLEFLGIIDGYEIMKVDHIGTLYVKTKS